MRLEIYSLRRKFVSSYIDFVRSVGGCCHVPDNHGQEPNSKTGNGPAAVQIVKGLRRRLHGATDEENEGTQHDRQPATEVITSRSGEESAEEGTAREERDNRSATKQQW